MLIARMWSSTTGKKATMAVTGVILFLFIIGHMVGNLKVFFGEEEFNHYAAYLRLMGSGILGKSGFLWIMRTALTLAVILHITAATQLTRRAHAARPVKYVSKRPVQGSYAARTMRWGGVIIVLFVIYHLLDLTTGTINPHGVHGEVYQNITADFAADRWYVTLFYALSVIALTFHLRHGLWSALQSLGASNQVRERVLKSTALTVALLICIGFLAVPFGVMTGLVK